jgi:uncharacterized protein (DUF2267 family)
MEPDDLIGDIQAHAGLDQPAAERALAAVLETLGERLPHAQASGLAGALPPSLAQRVMRRLAPGELSAETFFARIAEREGIKEGFGREHAQVVGRALIERLPPAVIEPVCAVLPEEITQIFARESVTAPPPPPALHGHDRAHQSGRTLSTGRPGSRHPINESGAEADTLATGRPGSKHPLNESR